MAPLTQIVAFFEKKIWGAFWRFSGQKRALPDSKHLATLAISVKVLWTGHSWLMEKMSRVGRELILYLENYGRQKGPTKLMV